MNNFYLFFIIIFFVLNVQYCLVNNKMKNEKEDSTFRQTTCILIIQRIRFIIKGYPLFKKSGFLSLKTELC